MIKESVAFVANYLWMASIRNMSAHLTEAEQKMFSSNDYYYLTIIYYLGRPNFTQVADALKLTKPAISVFVNKLTRMGLLEKVQSGDDKRMYYVCITQKGKSIIEGDEALYKKLDDLIKSIAVSQEQYIFVEKMLSELVIRLDEEQQDNL